MRRQLFLCTIVFALAKFAFCPEACAQPSTTELSGTVVSSSTKLPVHGVQVFVDGNHLVAVSNSDGEYSFSGVVAGEYLLHLIHDGYSPKSFQMSIPAGSQGEIDLGLALLEPGPPPSASLSGSIRDAMAGLPVPTANVTVNGEQTVSTDQRGTFVFYTPNLRWGANPVGIRMVGYEPMIASLWVLENESELSLDVQLYPLAVRLPEVVVEGDRTTYVYGRSRHFYRRRGGGLGTFVTRADIQELKPLEVSSLFKRIPGIFMRESEQGLMTPFFVRKGFFECKPIIFHNGIRAHSSFEFDMYRPEDIDGIEVYSGPSQIPPEFNPTGAACGVMVIWTR